MEEVTKLPKPIIRILFILSMANPSWRFSKIITRIFDSDFHVKYLNSGKYSESSKTTS